MIREQLVHGGHGHHRGEPWRSHEIARIEGLSDAVFAFAVTLLVVSLEVPKTFNELWETMRGFLAFAISFTMLFQVWYAQYQFFRRFALHDTYVTVINGVLLFVVLFYVYPLKFLFSYLINVFTGGHGMVKVGGHPEPMLEGSQALDMMLIYNLGFIAVFGVFVLLYRHALKLQYRLQLNEREVFDAHESLWGNLLNVLIGVLSIAILYGTRNAGLAGLTYMLVGLAQTIHGAVFGKRRRQRFPAMEPSATA